MDDKLESAVVVGGNIRRLRMEKKLTIGELADTAEMQLNALSRVERGERDTRLSTVVRIASALGVPVSKLVDGI